MRIRYLLVLLALGAAGCAVDRATQPPPAPAAAAEAPPVVTPEARDEAAPEPPVADAAPVTPSAPARSKAAASQPTPAAPASRDAATAPRAADEPAAQAPVAAQAPTDTLDFAALGARLRATKAIGVLTKLAVKNQADDLLAQFRDYYMQRGTATLPDLHRTYDALVTNLLALLQDGDPPLATDIDRSRAALWDVLSDPRKFVDSHLMAKTP
jgi:hypothetical protein